MAWVVFFNNLPEVAVGLVYTGVIGYAGYRWGRRRQRIASRKEMNLANTARELR